MGAYGVQIKRGPSLVGSLGSSCRYKRFFMYRRHTLCTLYGAVDFLNVLKKGCWLGGGGGGGGPGGGVLMVHS